MATQDEVVEFVDDGGSDNCSIVSLAESDELWDDLDSDIEPERTSLLQTDEERKKVLDEAVARLFQEEAKSPDNQPEVQFVEETPNKVEQLNDAAEASNTQKRASIPLIQKLFACQMRIVQKKSYGEIVKEFALRFHRHIERKQVLAWATDVDKLLAAYRQDSDKCRVTGAGRKSLCHDREADTVKKIEELRKQNQKVDVESVRLWLGGEKKVSNYVVHSFLSRNKLKVRDANVKQTQTAEQVELGIQKFFQWSSHVNWCCPLLSAAHIVQFDECAESMCGSMTSQVKTVVAAQEADHVVKVTNCDLYDTKKICSGVHFLSVKYIPPIAIFRGKKTLKEKLCIRGINTAKGCMRSSVVIQVILPHIMRHNPEVRVVVFDNATSHYTDEVEQEIKRLGLFAMVIPSGLTSVLQALDTSFFAMYRHLRWEVASRVVATKGAENLQKLSAAEKRTHVCRMMLDASIAANKGLDVEKLFLQHGYLRPSPDTIVLRNAPGYTFVPPLVDDVTKWITKATDEAERHRVSQAEKAICLSKAVENAVALPSSAKKIVRGKKSAASQSNTLDRMWAKLTKQDESPLKKNRTEVPEPATERKTLGLKISPLVDVIDVDSAASVQWDTQLLEMQVTTQLDEEMKHAPNYACWSTGSLIPTQVLSELVRSIGKMPLPEGTVIHDWYVTSLYVDGRKVPVPSHLIPENTNHLLSVFTFYEQNHYILVTWRKGRGIFVFDSYEDYRPKLAVEAAKRLKEFVMKTWEQSCVSVLNGHSRQQQKHSNDCGIFVLNNIIEQIFGKPGKISRSQMQLKYIDRDYEWELC